jgi:DNA-binding CsgD family transcriptional regulator/5-carboxymethyl-2-hydroxymuconate isomerase
MTRPPDILEADDARAIVSVLGEVCGHPGDITSRKRHLMDSICRIIGADCWAWGLAAQMEPGKPSIHLSLLHGGFSEETYASFTQAYTHPDMTGIHNHFAAELAERRCHLTRTLQQMDPEEAYKKTGAYPHWQGANIGGIIMSLRPLDQTTFSIIGIYRKLGSEPFSQRENRISHILLSEVPELHREGWPSDNGVTLRELSGRQHSVLSLLIHGYSRNRIAEHYGLSLHTVNDHVKAIFRHFGVHSQAALIAYFRNGDGGDG